MAYAMRPCFEPALRRLDLLLHREILRLRANYQLSLDEFRGLYISDKQVDSLIQEWTRSKDVRKGVQELTEEADRLAQISRRQLTDDSAWAHVTSEFRLSLLEHDMLLLALAPEFHSKYKVLYAYLNNDVRCKYPTVDIAMRLFGDHDPHHARAVLSLVGRLFTEHLLIWHPSGSEQASLSAGFFVAPTVRHYLLNLSPADPNLLHRSQYHPCPPPRWEELVCPTELRQKLQGMGRLLEERNPGLLVVLEGETGSGRFQAAQSILGAADKGLISADLFTLRVGEASLLTQVQHLATQARLANAGLFFRGLDRLMAGEPRERRALAEVLPYLADVPLAVFFAIPPDLRWRQWLSEKTALRLSFPDPTASQREQLWLEALARHELYTAETEVAEVADRFLLNAGQIGAAVSTIHQQQCLRPNSPKEVDIDQLFAAAREESVSDMGKSAQKVKVLYRWEDLVLPPTTLQRIREIVAAIRNRKVVYRDWDMQNRMGGTFGLMILFSGASGTGKTMTASVMSKEIGLDLYRIDLSNVVSKYIGETEKNLDRIFTAARRANCILFFDEADALFGKRTEVKDAHDRYANIEVAYLLQKMEGHDGVVILATNIAKNMDQAFARRMHYAVEFPRPNAEHRERLWQGMFSRKTPLAEDVDFGFLARRFDTTGGDIKTVALEAAMLAASNGQHVTMACLVKAMARQMIKQGQVPSATDFKQYYGLLR